MSTLWSRPLLASSLAAAVLALVYALVQTGMSSQDATTTVRPRELLLGPASLGHGGTIELEVVVGSIPRIRVVGGRVYNEASLISTQSFFDRVLKLRRPFTVLWDPRGVRWPSLSGKQLKMIRQWVDQNAAQWDSRVQAHALYLTNPLLRALAGLVIRLFAPPQPTKLVDTDAEALEFARTCCPKPRSWVKKTYADRDQRFGVFGTALGLGGSGSTGVGATSCSLKLPSLRGWSDAFAIHLSLVCLLGAPLALLLHAAPTRHRRPIGVTAACLSAVAVVVAVDHGRRIGYVRWMGAFLASTSGFGAFFKAMAYAHSAFPPGADANRLTWLLWFTSMPEPLFAADGRMRPSLPRELPHRLALLLLKLTTLGIVLSVLLRTPAHIVLPNTPALNAMSHLWVIYLWAGACLDIGSALVMLSGGTVDPPFRNPLLASRSLRETWGSRWNTPVHVLLKRAVYVPARHRGASPIVASVATFIASGLLHEYNFGVHNAPAYVHLPTTSRAHH